MTARRGTWAWGAYAALLLLAPLVFTSDAALTLLSQMATLIIVCLSYNLLLGEGGLLSFGHAVFVGAGAYAAIHALNAGPALPVTLLPLVGGLGALAAAATLGAFITKRGGTVFAMITLGIGELVVATAPMFPAVFGGEAGISADRAAGAAWFGITFGPSIEIYYLVAAYCFVCTVALYALTQTPFGRLLNAVRDNPERVEFIGQDPRVVRFVAFAIAGFFAGIGGALGALSFESVSAESFGAARSGAILLFTFLGGSAAFFGPIVGAVIMVLALGPLSAITPAWQVYVGAAFVLMVMFAPGGVAGLWKRRWTRPGAVHLVAAALASMGAVATIEMVYHRRLDSGFDPVIGFFGLSLDTNAVAPWATAIGAGSIGLALFFWKRRR